jgi:hypothetical protein
VADRCERCGRPNGATDYGDEYTECFVSTVPKSETEQMQCRAFAAARQAGREEERARVVAFLNEVAVQRNWGMARLSEAARVICNAAKSIEAGKHIEEEL